jgi:uncharacterized protein (TIGR02145 family)
MTTIYATSDQSETILSMADRVVYMKDGEIQRQSQITEQQTERQHQIREAQAQEQARIAAATSALAAEKAVTEAATKSGKAVAGKNTFTDPRDGRVYKTVKIGNQVWMAENLNYDVPGSKFYDNDPQNGEKYGRLYDWETAKKACPPGWHLPSKEEWDVLCEFVGGEEGSCKRLKAKSGWDDYKGKNGNGTDDYGFSALPGGSRNADDSFGGVGWIGQWWSASESYNDYDACYREMRFNNSRVLPNYGYKIFLLSVRCLQD